MEIDRTQKISREAIYNRSIPSICAHCGNIYKINTWQVEEGKITGVSHGLCPDCFEKERARIEQMEDVRQQNVDSKPRKKFFIRRKKER